MINTNDFYQAFGVDARQQTVDHLRVNQQVMVQASDTRVLLLSERVTVHDKGLFWLKEQNQYPNLIAFASRNQYVGVVLLYEGAEDETQQAISEANHILNTKNL